MEEAQENKIQTFGGNMKVTNSKIKKAKIGSGSGDSPAKEEWGDKWPDGSGYCDDYEGF